MACLRMGFDNSKPSSKLCRISQNLIQLLSQTLSISFIAQRRICRTLDSPSQVKLRSVLLPTALLWWVLFFSNQKASPFIDGRTRIMATFVCSRQAGRQAVRAIPPQTAIISKRALSSAPAASRSSRLDALRDRLREEEESKGDVSLQEFSFSGNVSYGTAVPKRNRDKDGKVSVVCLEVSVDQNVLHFLEW